MPNSIDKFRARSSQTITLRCGNRTFTLEVDRDVDIKLVGAARAGKKKAPRPQLVVFAGEVLMVATTDKLTTLNANGTLPHN